ncbi:MAG: hypothetical protein JWN15_822 [Firmicutes bacterium]|nr:hypothetical protein [Bacillota bacterium]
MITSYVRHMPAEYHDDCHNCGQQYIEGEMIYWHGRIIHARHLAAASHEGCFWDSLKNGPAPHLTWWQVVAIDSAIHGKILPPNDEWVRRFVGAVSTNITRRPREMFKGDADAGLRMGPGLLEGYRHVLKALGLHKDPIWHPVEANGCTKWVNPDRAPKLAAIPAQADFAQFWRERQLIAAAH